MTTSAKLSDEVKTFIVQALACHDTPSIVVASVKDEFGIDVSRQAVQSYDPTKHAGRDLAKKWRQIFEATREAFVEETVKIPVSQRASRLRRIQRMADKAESMRNFALAASLLEQAAKECGGAFTNKQRLEHAGPEGSPIQTDNVLRIEFVEPGKDAPDAVDPGAGGV